MNEGGAIAVILIILLVSWAVAAIVAWARIFQKAGEAWGKMFIPVYGQYLQYRIAGCPGVFIANMVLSGIISTISYIVTMSQAYSYSYSYYYSSSGNFTWLIVLYAIWGIIEFILMCVFCSGLSSNFGRNGGFTAGLIFLHPIFILILGFGSAEYIGSGGGYSRLPKAAGTWKCPQCGASNPVSRASCAGCGGEKPRGIAAYLEAPSAAPGSAWKCVSCGEVNPVSRATCAKCGKEKARGLTSSGVWKCPHCGTENPNSRGTCMECGKIR